MPISFPVNCKKTISLIFLMSKARQDIYSDLISNNGNDLKHLFKVSKYLLNIPSTPVLPPHENKQQLANELSTFFIRKIANIRSDLDNRSPQVCRMDSNNTTSSSLSPIWFIISAGGARLDPCIQEEDLFFASDSYKTCFRMLGYSSSRNYYNYQLFSRAWCLLISVEKCPCFSFT